MVFQGHKETQFRADHLKNVELQEFLAATKQLYEWFSPSARPSVRHTFFHYVPIIVSSWNFQE